MRILQLHVNKIEFEPVEREIKEAEETERKKIKLENLLVLFTAVESGDDEDVAKNAIEETKRFAKQLGVKRVLIYPYAHLTQNLASPTNALKILKRMSSYAKEVEMESYRAPFGWTKRFSIDVKGHPLAEQFRVFTKRERKREKKLSEELEKLHAEVTRKIGVEKAKVWDSCNHLLAAAVKKAFPKVALGLGGVEIDNFYYDFESKFTESDLEQIEREMMKLVEQDVPFESKKVSKAEARKIFAKEKFKLDLLEELPNGCVTLCKIGDFIDICEHQHVKSTGQIKAIKLLKIGGAYWKGDPSNPMLQRIYGVAFQSKLEMENFLKLKSEAERRDHRKLGKQLDLFSFHKEGPGFVFLHPNGMIIWNELIKFWISEHAKRGYLQIRTPIILRKKLWEQSGHWEHYRESMYFTQIDRDEYAIKPMNCPGAILVYKSKRWSYKDLPLRLAEIGLVHRHELSGVLCGLFRVRSFTQDDAHIFTTPEKLKDEITRIIKLCDYFYKLFGFKYHVELSTRPKNSIGTKEMWEQAERALKAALAEMKIKYKLNPGEGAFYGPKIDLHLKDCLGRGWQCGTIQVDFAMPERFDLTYTGKDGKEHRPVMVHRVIYGSIERFLGILIEHYGGALPVWLSPIQTIVLPVSEKNVNYAEKIRKELAEKNIRVKVDYSSNTLEYKIRNAQLKKIPYMIIVGKEEEQSATISVRRRNGKIERGIKLSEFIKSLLAEINSFNSRSESS